MTVAWLAMALVLATAPAVTTDAQCREDNPIPVRLVRLAQSELLTHLASALGDEVVRGEGAPVFHLQGDEVHVADERTVNSADFGSYRNAARLLARRYARALPPDATCLQPKRALACVHGPLKTLMLRLFRDQLPTADWSHLARAYLEISAMDGPTEALQSVLNAALLSPAVLYRTEAGLPANGGRALSPVEALEAASFAVRGHAPDLRERDEVVRLSGQPGFQDHLARMARQWTRTPAFRDRATGFTREWLGVSHIGERLVRPALAGAAPFEKDDISYVLLNEFDAFVKDHLLDEGGGFARFFTATETRYFPALEQIYGGHFIPPDRIRWDARVRKGVLGLGAVLAAHATDDATDPVKRGMLVRLRILCEPMPAPVPDADLGRVGITKDMQTRERFDALARAPACRSCHTIINPPGYLFESFDQVGRLRQVEKGRPVDDRGGIPAFFGQKPYPGVGAWSGIAELADWLARAPQARLCYARDFSNHLLAARVFETPDSCALSRIAARFVRDGTIADLVEDMVRSDVFRRRVERTP